MPSVHCVPSPWGELMLLAQDGLLRGVSFVDRRQLDAEGAPASAHRAYESEADRGLLERAADQLAAYAAGSLHRFDLPLQPRGTSFQRAVWRALAAWPFGQTLSYAELAVAAGHAPAVRAVGNAVGANPWVIVVPCHRVLASGGRLGGFSSGLHRKRALLRHEHIAWHDDAGCDELPLFAPEAEAEAWPAQRGS